MGAMGWKLDDLPIFVAIAEQGSITAAADVLAVPKSTVSTVLARLERDLGVRLMARTSRNLRLTAEGGTFLRHAQAILEQAREADTTMAGMRAEPTGRLAVALPPAFCQEIVAPRLAAFRARYPRIALELIVTSRGAGLLRDQVDLDSMDWLNFLVRLHKRFEVDIPESQYAYLRTIDDLTTYIDQHR